MSPWCLDLLDKIALLLIILPLRSSVGSGFLTKALIPVGGTSALRFLGIPQSGSLTLASTKKDCEIV